jgi:predicted CXXCH cytochrome family protein
MVNECGRGESDMKRLLSFPRSAALLICLAGFLPTAFLYAQRQPAPTKGPSVAWKAPVQTNPNDYVGPQVCSGCHRGEARQFFKSPHGEQGQEVEATPAAPGAAESPSVAAGRKLYNDMMCAGCHQIGGKGGTVGPALDDVGARRTREELMDRMLKRRAGTIMPTLPPDTPTKNIEALVDYMVTLKGQTHNEAQTAAAPSGPKLVTGCEICHGPGAAHANAEQNAAGDPEKMEAGMKLIFKFDANPKENSERCMQCHATGTPQDAFPHSVHASAGVSCIDCHSVHPVDVADAGKPALEPAQSHFFSVPRLKEENAWLTDGLLKKPQPELCFSCHQTVQAQFALPEHHRVGEGFMKCTDCHNPHGTMNHNQLTNAGWETCVKCHVEKRGPFLYEHAVVRVEGCASCHTPHGSVNNFLLKRREPRQLCLQCHSAIHPEQGSGSMALHGQANVPHGRGGYQTSGDCTRCHVAVHGSNFDEYLLR